MTARAAPRAGPVCASTALAAAWVASGTLLPCMAPAGHRGEGRLPGEIADLPAVARPELKRLFF